MPSSALGSNDSGTPNCLETSDPNSFLVMCYAKRDFHA